MLKKYLAGVSLDILFYFVFILLQFLLIPIFLKYITIEQLGIYFTIQAIFGFLGLAGQLSANHYFVKKASSDKIFSSNEINKYYSNVFLFQIIGFVTILIIGVITSKNLTLIFDKTWDKDLYKTFILMLLGFSIHYFFGLYHSIFRARKELVFINFIENFNLILINIFTIFFMVLGYKLLSFGIGYIISIVLVNSIIIIKFKYTFKNIYFSKKFLSIKVMKDSINYMKHFIFLVFANIGRNSYMPILITKTVGIKYVSMFIISYKASQILQGIISKISLNVFPFLAKNYEDEPEEIKKIYIIFSKICMRLAMFGSIIIFILNEHFIRLWVGDDKFIGYYNNLLLSIVTFIYIYASGIGVFINASGRFKKLAIISITDIFIALTISVILVPYYGITSLLLGFIFSRLGSFLYTIKYLNNENSISTFKFLKSTLLYSLLPNIISFFIFSFMILLLKPIDWIELIITVLFGGISHFSIDILRFIKYYKNNNKKQSLLRII